MLCFPNYRYKWIYFHRYVVRTHSHFYVYSTAGRTWRAAVPCPPFSCLLRRLLLLLCGNFICKFLVVVVFFSQFTDGLELQQYTEVSHAQLPQDGVCQQRCCWWEMDLNIVSFMGAECARAREEFKAKRTSEDMGEHLWRKNYIDSNQLGDSIDKTDERCG